LSRRYLNSERLLDKSFCNDTSHLDLDAVIPVAKAEIWQRSSFFSFNMEHPRHHPVVLVFGPQSLTLDQAAVSRLHRRLCSSASLSWVLETLLGLQGWWAPLAKAIPGLQHLGNGGESALGGVAAWLQFGDPGHLPWPLPNIVLTPLTVVQHLAELYEIRDGHGRASSHNRGSVFGCLEVVGLCTGLLTASALALSSDESQLAVHGSAAIRLAMLIGAVVDAQDSRLDEQQRAVSFAIDWDKNGTKTSIEEAVKTISSVSASGLWHPKCGRGVGRILSLAISGTLYTQKPNRSISNYRPIFRSYRTSIKPP
jgi:hypothetical protein